MRIPIKTIASAAAGAVVSYHFSAALDLFGGKEHINALMDWLPGAFLTFIAMKWVLAISTFVLGMIFADWIIRRTVKSETRPDFFTGLWLNHKKRMLLLGLKHPSFVPLDLRYELLTMNAALISPGIDMPALPTTDPADPRISETRMYLSSIGSLRPGRLPEARRIALAMVEAFPPSNSAPPGIVRRFRQKIGGLLGRQSGRP